jgi:hypothetical protein
VNPELSKLLSHRGAAIVAARTGRPGDGTCHITWSLGSGREPLESNHVIAEWGWRVATPVKIDLVPVKRPMP